jgi:hypothetical protein
MAVHLQVPVANFFLSMGGTLVFMVHNLSLFGDDKDERAREVDAGMNMAVYFLAKVRAHH